MKGYSIITDFGCKTNCSYCIWKSHPMYGKEFNKTNWLSSVSNFINKCPNKKLSISGGGDPLNEIYNNMDFWDIVRLSCWYNNKKIDIHTSYTNWRELEKNYLNYMVNRMVLHSNCQKAEEQVKYILSQTDNFPKIRINFVITDKIDIDILKWVETQIGETQIQIAYRQYVGDTENASPEVIKFCSKVGSRLQNGRYVLQNDYNIYLFPNGKVYKNFLTAGKEND